MKAILILFATSFMALLLFSSCSREELDDMDTYREDALRTSIQINNPDPSTREYQESEGITITNSGIDPDEDEDEDDDDDEYRSIQNPNNSARVASRKRKS